MKKFDWNGKSIPANEVQLKIFTETGFSTAQRTAWKNAIESHTGGKIQVIIETIQENL